MKRESGEEDGLKRGVLVEIHKASFKQAFYTGEI